ILGEAVGHAGEVIADGTLNRSGLGTPLIAFRQKHGVLAKLVEKCVQEAPALRGHALDAAMVVDPAVPKLLQIFFDCLELRAGSGQGTGRLAHLGPRADLLLPSSLASVLPEIAHLPVDQGANHRRLQLLRTDPRMLLADLLGSPLPEG